MKLRSPLAFCSLLFVFLLLPAVCYSQPANVRIADRVVVAINNIPYSQLQIERYVDVKESLRDNPGASEIVKESNWPLAVEAFIKDMTIHQEASKSSGFRPSREAILKLRMRSEKSLDTVAHFKSAFEHLMLDRAEIENEVLKVATVENYRRGKASLNTNGKSSVTNWESDLIGRTTVRFFDEAKAWKTIQPKP